MKPDIEKLLVHLRRAASAVGHDIHYKLGQGGTHPEDALPTRNKLCDCSGFVAWVLGLCRAPKPARKWWIETTAVYNDATGKQSVFVLLRAPIPGCCVVFPDRNGHQGHIGIVDKGDAHNFTVVDCTSKGITLQDGSYFREHGAIFCCLREDAS